MYRQTEDMRAGVLNALYWDLRVPRHQVRVEIENGWVTVSGTVDLPIRRLAPSSTSEASREWSASPT